MANPIIISEPHKVINSFDSPWNASALPIQYTVSNDKYPIGAVVSNYYTEIIISVNAVIIATIQQLPDSNNETKIDVRKYIQSALSFIPSTFFGTGNDSNASCFFSISGEEKYLDSNGNAQSNPIDSGGNAYYASNSALQFGDANGGNMYDYVLDSTKLDLAKWMTRFQRGSIIDINNFTFSIIVNDPDFDLSVDQFDKSGALLVNEIVNIPDNGVGVYRLSSSLSELNIATKYLTVEGQKLGIPVTELLPIDVDLACLELPEAPINFTLSNPTISTLDASCVSDGISFEWELSTDENFGVIDFSITNATTTAQFTGIGKGEIYYGRVRVLGSPNSPDSNTDTATTLTGYEDFATLFAFRRLSVNSTFSCRLMRSSDNDEQFLLLPDKPLTEFISLSSMMSGGQTLGDWVGVNDAVMTSGTNQSSAINDNFSASQADAPWLVIGGVLQTKDGIPCAVSDGTKFLEYDGNGSPATWWNTGVNWTSFVVSYNDTSEDVGGHLATRLGVNSLSVIRLLRNRITGSKSTMNVKNDLGVGFNVASANDDISNDRFINQNFLDSGNSELNSWTNNVTGEQNIPFGGTYSSEDGIQIFSTGSSALNGGISEIIQDDSDLTATRASIRDEINSAHNVY